MAVRTLDTVTDKSSCQIDWIAMAIELHAACKGISSTLSDVGNVATAPWSLASLNDQHASASTPGVAMRGAITRGDEGSVDDRVSDQWPRHSY